MNEVVFAKDAKAGQWYESGSGNRLLCIEKELVVNRGGTTAHVLSTAPLTHLPDCTGWDWQPPKPKKKYRPFSGVDEFLCHLESRCPHDWFFRKKSHPSSYHLTITAFSDDGLNGESWQSAFDRFVWSKDGSPFGVEVDE